jgi:DNA-binding response OmpR family regulator
LSKKVAVLCWEESRPWVSALRQKGYSVPWVDEPKNEVGRQFSDAEPDVLLVDLTRLPEQGEGVVSALASKGTLSGIRVVLVMSDGDTSNGLTGKVDGVSVTTPKKLVSAVKAALAGR